MKYLQKLIEWPSLFIGSSPKKVSAMYSLLSYSMLKDGTYVPKKGMIEIINTVHKLFEATWSTQKAVGCTEL